MMTVDSRAFRDPKHALGMPEDEMAADVTSKQSMIGLLKWIANSSNSVAAALAQTDDAAFTIGTGKVSVSAGIYKSVRDSVDDGDAGALAMNVKRGLYISPESPSGDSLVDDVNDRLNVGLISAQNGVDGGAGASTAKTLRVVNATDDSMLAAVIAAVENIQSASDTVEDKLSDLRETIDGMAEALAVALDKLHLDIMTPRTADTVDTALHGTKVLTNAAASFSSSGDNTLVTGVAGQTIRVHRIVLVAAAAVSITIKDATSGNSLTGAMPLSINGSITLDYADEPWFVTAAGGNFVVNLSGAVAVTGFVQYRQS